MSIMVFLKLLLFYFSIFNSRNIIIWYLLFFNKNDGVTGFGMDLFISSTYTKFINYHFNNVYPSNNLVVKANNMLLYDIITSNH